MHRVTFSDISLLRELSMDPRKSALPQRVSALVTRQNETLLRALRLPSKSTIITELTKRNNSE